MFQAREGTVVLPYRLTELTMRSLVAQAVNAAGDPRFAYTIFDFSRLNFIDPTGIVVLGNLLEYVAKRGGQIHLRIPTPLSPATVYLDDSGFFRHYLGKYLRADAKLRSTTMRLERVETELMVAYLEFRLLPWIAARVGLAQTSIDGVKACLEEIYNNIYDHAGVDKGYTFAQVFPREDVIHVAIADFGAGIPTVVRRVLPDVDDAQALFKAAEEGFTTQSNVRNRGAGLPNLMRYVTRVNRGTVQLFSGKGDLIAFHHQTDGTRIRVRRTTAHYPGTLVKVILRTDTFEAFEEDVQPEVFQW